MLEAAAKGNTGADASSSPSTPILLFGMPRSGTTWIGKLFDSHPETLYRHEPDSWQRLSMPRYPHPDDACAYEQSLLEFVGELPHMNALRVAGKRPLFGKSYLSPTRTKLMSAGISIARVGSRLYPGFPVFLHAAGSDDCGRRVVWKSIESLSRLGVVLAVLKNATAIQILRHPCGYVASVQRGLSSRRFSDNTSSSEDYGIFQAAIGTPLGDRYGLNMKELQAMRPAERLAWRWVLINEKAMLECQDSGRWACVRYEDVCADPVAVTHRLFGFTGLSPAAQTRTFIEQSTRRDQGGYYSVIKQSSAVAWRWREELDPDTIARVNAILAQSRMSAYYPESTSVEAVSS